MVLNINSDAVVVFTNKLEQMRKSALPVAIRTALNSAAFDVKQNTMPKSALNKFIHRQPNFFKANSRVEMAKGWDINTMAAIVGFTDEHLKNVSTNFAIKDLEQQEYGGDIDKKSFIPTDKARTGGSAVKPVRPKNRLTEIEGIRNSNRIDFSGSTNKKAKFIQTVFKAGVGGYVIGNDPHQMLWKIESITRGKKGIQIKKTALYSFKQDRRVNVKETGFMRWASFESANKLEKFYIIEAQKQIDRLLK